jgi:hypothetical protein
MEMTLMAFLFQSVSRRTFSAFQVLANRIMLIVAAVAALAQLF